MSLTCSLGCLLLSLPRSEQHVSQSAVQTTFSDERGADFGPSAQQSFASISSLTAFVVVVVGGGAVSYTHLTLPTRMVV